MACGKPRSLCKSRWWDGLMSGEPVSYGDTSEHGSEVWPTARLAHRHYHCHNYGDKLPGVRDDDNALPRRRRTGAHTLSPGREMRIRIALVLLVLPALARAQDRWKIIAHSQQGTEWSYDTVSFRRSGPTVKVWLRIVHVKPDTNRAGQEVKSF